jgi:hypothetical protein
MHGIDQLLTRKRLKPGLVITPTSANLGDDHQVIRIGMEGLLNNLIRYMRAVKVAGVDMIDAGCNRFSQNCDRTVNVTRWSPDSGTGKLHRAIAHAVQCYRSAGEREAAAKIRPFRHFGFSSRLWYL